MNEGKIWEDGAEVGGVLYIAVVHRIWLSERAPRGDGARNQAHQAKLSDLIKIFASQLLVVFVIPKKPLI